MRSGPKRLSADEKQARGTYQACRDKPVHMIVDGAPPICPTYLPAEAREVFDEELPRVAAAGIIGLDTSFYAAYCAVEAQVRSMIASGQLPSGNLLTELRRRQEVLGIAGPSSRALRGTASPEQATNPFAALPPR